jgi:poly(3-hydroxybutyrate) depolymerase
MDGSSGRTSLKRTHYETEVMQAAIEKIKAKYGIKELGLVGLSGGGGLVADLIAERQDVLCAVSASGVTSAVSRAKEKGLSADVETHTPFSNMWDPIDQLPRVHPMPGFRMFVASDITDGAVSFTSQKNYVRQALKDGLPISQIEVHGTGEVHHETANVGNRIVQACMAGAPTDYIVKTFTGMNNNSNDLDTLARKILVRVEDKPV